LKSIFSSETVCQIKLGANTALKAILKTTSAKQRKENLSKEEVACPLSQRYRWPERELVLSGAEKRLSFRNKWP
jgi:hypothetical protein